MNDKPRTMMLAPHEWRTLVTTTAAYVHAQAQSFGSDAPNAEQTKWFHEQIDRLKMQVSAWGASGQQAQPSPSAITDEMKAFEQAEALVNGSGEVIATPKKKRGWQKGRKRGPRQPKGEAVQ